MKKYTLFIGILSCLVISCFSNGMKAEETPYNQINTIVGDTETDGEFNVTITEQDQADTIVLDFASSRRWMLWTMNGSDSSVMPGTEETGKLHIKNETKDKYQVTGLQLEYDAIYIMRIYNDAAKAAGLTPSQAASYADDDWYRLNVAYYGEANLNDFQTLRNMLGDGTIAQGNALRRETDAKMIELGKRYLFMNTKVSMNQDVYPVNAFVIDSPITVSNLVTADIQTIIRESFPNLIDEQGLTSTLGFSYNAILGNAYNGAYADVGFKLTLTRIKEPQAKLSVTYDSCGGSIVEAVHNLEKGAYLKKPMNPTREGYRFVGWYTSSQYTTLWDYDTNVVERTMTLYAKWEPIKKELIKVAPSKGGPNTTDSRVNHIPIYIIMMISSGIVLWRKCKQEKSNH